MSRIEKLATEVKEDFAARFRPLATRLGADQHRAHASSLGLTVPNLAKRWIRESEILQDPTTTIAGAYTPSIDERKQYLAVKEGDSSPIQTQAYIPPPIRHDA